MAMEELEQRGRKRRALGAHAHHIFAINKEGPFLFSRNFPLFLIKKVPLKCRAPKLEMLPTSLDWRHMKYPYRGTDE